MRLRDRARTLLRGWAAHAASASELECRRLRVWECGFELPATEGYGGQRGNLPSNSRKCWFSGSAGAESCKSRLGDAINIEGRRSTSTNSWRACYADFVGRSRSTRANRAVHKNDRILTE